MNNPKTVLGTALATVLALGSMAAQSHEAEMEKCAGVVKAGQNDCGTSTGGCHGSVKVDGNKEAWIAVPKGSCEKIIGAYVTSSPYAIPGGKQAYEESLKKGNKKS